MLQINKLRRLLFTGITVAFVASGCAGGVNLYSKSQDKDLGAQIQAEIAKNPKEYPVLNNPAVRDYVQGIVNRIVQSPSVKNKDFNYQVTIINDPNTINAFSIPGGPMYVYTGLMKFIDDEATLAGVMAHEITHADSRHATERLTKVYGMQAVVALALGQNAGLAAQIATDIAGGLAVLRFSRDDEREADKYSFTDLYELPGQPWYPAAIKSFHQKTLEQSKSQPSKFERLLLTHPAADERIALIDKYAAEAKLGAPSATQINRSEYQRIKSMLP